jgi:hypothetical protein
MKSKISNMIDSGLLIQPKLACCRRAESLSSRKLSDQISWNADLISTVLRYIEDDKDRR